jgi:hypothetical protein
MLLAGLRTANNFWICVVRARSKGVERYSSSPMPPSKRCWETGNPTTVTAAMTTFRSENQDALLERSPVPKADQADYREWSKRFAKWLYSTEHIKIQYSIDYDGVDIRKLSPGTRGIVLLLLYLALDDADDRPLIIDQPEENLDPKSIFDELVGLFREAKNKRQVIMVTHNANLVVNTDADQIIIAQVGPHPPGRRSHISRAALRALIFVRRSATSLKAVSTHSKRGRAACGYAWNAKSAWLKTHQQASSEVVFVNRPRLSFESRFWAHPFGSGFRTPPAP